MKDYIGNELELFKHAHHWKEYYAKCFKHLLKGEMAFVMVDVVKLNMLIEASLSLDHAYRS